MKILISADIEGVTGITDWEEADLSHPTNVEFRERMTAEVVAACEGALAAGADEIVVRDAHGTGRNVLAERLPREATLVRGWSGHPYCMVEGIDSTFAAAAFIGWHSAAGLGGNPLAHTLSSRRLAAVRINGLPAAEFHIHAWACGLEGVPVVFVSGDEELCGAVTNFDEAIDVVAVSRGRGASTWSMHPADAREQIRVGLRAALEKDLARLSMDMPPRFELEVVHKDARNAYRASFYPGARLKDAVTVAFDSDHYYEVLRAIRFVT